MRMEPTLPNSDGLSSMPTLEELASKHHAPNTDATSSEHAVDVSRDEEVDASSGLELETMNVAASKEASSHLPHTELDTQHIEVDQSNPHPQGSTSYDDSIVQPPAAQSYADSDGHREAAFLNTTDTSVTYALSPEDPALSAPSHSSQIEPQPLTTPSEPVPGKDVENFAGKPEEHAMGESHGLTVQPAEVTSNSSPKEPELARAPVHAQLRATVPDDGPLAQAPHCNCSVPARARIVKVWTCGNSGECDFFQCADEAGTSHAHSRTSPRLFPIDAHISAQLPSAEAPSALDSNSDLRDVEPIGRSEGETLPSLPPQHSSPSQATVDLPPEHRTETTSEVALEGHQPDSASRNIGLSVDCYQTPEAKVEPLTPEHHRTDTSTIMVVTLPDDVVSSALAEPLPCLLESHSVVLDAAQSIPTSTATEPDSSNIADAPITPVVVPDEGVVVSHHPEVRAYSQVAPHTIEETTLESPVVLQEATMTEPSSDGILTADFEQQSIDILPQPPSVGASSGSDSRIDLGDTSPNAQNEEVIVETVLRQIFLHSLALAEPRPCLLAGAEYRTSSDDRQLHSLDGHVDIFEDKHQALDAALTPKQQHVRLIDPIVSPPIAVVDKATVEHDPTHPVELPHFVDSTTSFSASNAVKSDGNNEVIADRTVVPEEGATIPPLSPHPDQSAIPVVAQADERPKDPGTLESSTTSPVQVALEPVSNILPASVVEEEKSLVSQFESNVEMPSKNDTTGLSPSQLEEVLSGTVSQSRRSEVIVSVTAEEGTSSTTETKSDAGKLSYPILKIPESASTDDLDLDVATPIAPRKAVTFRLPRPNPSALVFPRVLHEAKSQSEPTIISTVVDNGVEPHSDVESRNLAETKEEDLDRTPRHAPKELMIAVPPITIVAEPSPTEAQEAPAGPRSPPPVTSPRKAATQDVYEALRKVIEDTLDRQVKIILSLGQDDGYKSFSVTLTDDAQLLVRLSPPSNPVSIMESEVATMEYIRKTTSIPVPKILHWSSVSNPLLGPYIITEMPDGSNLQTVYNKLDLTAKIEVVKQIAQWTAELFSHRFEKIGSLYCEDETDFRVGPIVSERYYTDGRAKLDLDRGPWSSAKYYFMACAQREYDCFRALLAPNMSDEYQQMMNQTGLQVERSMTLLSSIVMKCKGLDEDDPAYAPFTLHLHEMQPKNIYVDKKDPSQIVSLVDWKNFTTKPLWHCAIPGWLTSSLYADPKDKERENVVRAEKSTILEAFKKTVMPLDILLYQGLDLGETRQTLEQICQYDVTQDGSFVLLTLQTVDATLPGAEDVAGLTQLLDPKTEMGRLARINLLTKGSATSAMGLASLDSPSFSRKSRSGSITAAPGQYVRFVPKMSDSDDD